MSKSRIDDQLAIALLGAGLTYKEAAPQCGAANGESLRRALLSRGITKKKIRGSITKTVTARICSAESERLRSDFAGILAEKVDALREMPVKRNLKAMKQFADVIEPLSRTAQRVHGWAEAPEVSIVSTQLDKYWK